MDAHFGQDRHVGLAPHAKNVALCLVRCVQRESLNVKVEGGVLMIFEHPLEGLAPLEQAPRLHIVLAPRVFILQEKNI